MAKTPQTCRDCIEIIKEEKKCLIQVRRRCACVSKFMKRLGVGVIVFLKHVDIELK